MATTSMLLLLSIMLVVTVCQGDIAALTTNCSPPAPAFTSTKCPTPDKTNFKFSVIGHRNQTGHWIAQVQLQHDSEQGQPGLNENESGQWRVDVEQNTMQCAAVHSVHIEATVTAPPPRAPPGCSAPGYKLFPGVGYYKFHKTGTTWLEAKEVCKQEVGHLVIINSEEESKVLQELFASEPNLQEAENNKYAFIGFDDAHHEGDYRTIFGEPLNSTGFRRWAYSGQPDNVDGNEDCGSVHRNGGLNDIKCWWKLAFFCEKELS